MGKSPKSRVKPAQPPKEKEGLPVYDSLASCAVASGIPLSIVKRAKRTGCPAFKSNRVHLRALLVWLFRKDSASSGVDWAATLKEMQAKREGLKYEEEAGSLVSLAEVQAQDAAACSRWNTQRVRIEQEYAARVSGKDVPECRTVLREFTTAVGRILEGVRG